MSMVNSKSVCGTKIVPGQHKRTEFCLEQVTKQNLYYLQKCKSQYSGKIISNITRLQKLREKTQ